jgi:hypothetical protein
LFFAEPLSQAIVTVRIQTKPAFSSSQPVPISIQDIILGVAGRRYDVMPDGKRFLVMLPERPALEPMRRTGQVNVVLNWFEELRSKQGK